MARWTTWVGRALAWWLLWQLTVRAWRKLFPRPRPGWLDWGLLGRLRPLLWSDEQLVERLGVEPGMHVIQVGAGGGRLTEALAGRVGPQGQLIVVDERLGVVEQVQLAALEGQQRHISVQHATPAALPAGAGSADLVVLTSVFGGAPDKAAVAAEAYRVLRPGGAVAISEFLVDPDYALASTVVTHLVLAGFGIEREVGGFAGYTVIGRKARASA
jgi:predicted methyltransferase